jgi:tagatose-6-phosphate ketose/aldose isomerase
MKVLMDPLSALLAESTATQAQRGTVHTPREIAQQPVTWQKTFGTLASKREEIAAFLDTAGLNKEKGQRPTVLLIGAGTSDYIGQCLHHLLRSEWQCEVIAVPSTSLLTDFSEYLVAGKPYLWISFSRSGESPEGVAVMERALAELPNVHHMVITCNARGRQIALVQGKPNCLGIVLDDATNDRSLAMTSSFSNMVLAGQMLAHTFTAESYELIFHEIVAAGRDLLPRAAEAAAELSREGYSRACFVGSGLLAGVARESALKLLELTAGQVKTMSESTLGLRHGPMAALDQETLFVSFLSGSEARRNYEIDLLREIGEKRLVRTRVAVAGSRDALERSCPAEHFLAPNGQWKIPDLYLPVVDVIFGQLMGLFSSLELDLMPDTPSPNGAISRVVQTIEIYQQ